MVTIILLENVLICKPSLENDLISKHSLENILISIHSLENVLISIHSLENVLISINYLKKKNFLIFIEMLSFQRLYLRLIIVIISG